MLRPGDGAALRLRCWRSSMRTMVQRAAAELDLEMIASRRTYALLDWLTEREQLVYPQEQGFMAGPLAPPPASVPAPPVPLPEAAQGDAWSWAALPAGLLREASAWPMDFSGLIPVPQELTMGLPSQARLFSQSRALAVAGWLGGLEPVRLMLDRRQLAGGSGRPLAGERSRAGAAKEIDMAFNSAREQVKGPNSSPSRPLQRSSLLPASG